MADYTSLTLVPYIFTFTRVLCLPLGMIFCRLYECGPRELSVILTAAAVVCSHFKSLYLCHPYISEKTTNHSQMREAHPSQYLALASCPASFWGENSPSNLTGGKCIFCSLWQFDSTQEEHCIAFYLTATILWPQTWIISTYDHHHIERI